MSDSEPTTSSTNDSPVIPYRAAPKPLGARFNSQFRAWARDTFNRDQMISSLKSLAWVAPLTMLIWVYAEREQIATVQNQIIPISIKSADPKLIVTVNPDDQNITAELSGPRVSVDKVTDALKLIPKSDQGVMIEISGAYAPGSYQILSSLVSDADLFKRAGVTISKPSPQNIHITIDRVVERELDVLVPDELVTQNLLVGTPTFEPRKVKISGPEAVLNAAAARNDLKAVVDLKNFKEVQTPGKHTLDNVPLVVSVGDKNVSVSPMTVRANLEVRPAEIEIKKDALPIFVTYPPNFTYRAEYFPSLPNVTMYGSRKAIEDMAKSGIQPKARFEVSTKDLPADVTRTTRLEFDLPPGIRMSDEDKLRPIEFKLVKLVTPE